MMLLVAVMCGVNLVLFWKHYLQLPLIAAMERQSAFFDCFWQSIKDTVEALPFTTFTLIAAMFAALLRDIVGQWKPSHLDALDCRRRRRVILVMSACITLATWTLTAMTANSPQQALGLLPVAMGLAIFSAVSKTPWPASTSQRHRMRLQAVVLGLFAVGVGGDALMFHQEVNLRRSVHDMTIANVDVATWDADATVPQVMKEIGFTVWKVPEHYGEAANAFSELVEFLRKEPDKFLMMGDETIIYGLTQKPSVSPFLWFHPGLVWRYDEQSFREMDIWLNDNLYSHRVTKVVVPANPSWMLWTPTFFEGLFLRIQPLDKCQRLGVYRICDVMPSR